MAMAMAMTTTMTMTMQHMSMPSLQRKFVSSKVVATRILSRRSIGGDGVGRRTATTTTTTGTITGTSRSTKWWGVDMVRTFGTTMGSHDYPKHRSANTPFLDQNNHHKLQNLHSLPMTMSMPMSMPSSSYARRWMITQESPHSSSLGKEDSSKKDTDDTTTPTPTPITEPLLVYQSPMGKLISRLKRISITSCLISVVGLPVLIYLKNGSWPNIQQLGLGGFAFLSAGGSTLALHFVFGPYVLELYQVPVRQCHHHQPPSMETRDDDTDDEGGKEDSADTPPSKSQQQQQQQQQQHMMIKATTRSIFGTTSEVVFDPLTDVTLYAGTRPFANFVVKGNTTLYCHPERLDEDLRRQLLAPAGADKDELSAKEATTGPRRPVDEDDGFL